MLPYKIKYKVTKDNKLIGIRIERNNGEERFLSTSDYKRLKDKEFLNAKITSNGRILSKEDIPVVKDTDVGI